MGHDSSKGSAFLRPKGMPSFSPSVILSPVEIGSPNGSQRPEDLEVAAQLLRQTFRGPVCALGFSAGGHLVASVGLRTSQATRPLEAQALVYPCIDGRDWADEDTCGFWGDDFDECFRKAGKTQQCGAVACVDG
eukprot:g411.t1